MKSTELVLDAIRNHAEIECAAITGSLARPGAADRYSDLDVLLLARDWDRVCDVRAWIPAELRILVCAFHLTNYCSVLLDNLEKMDLAIFRVGTPPSRWVVHDYQVVKGGPDFAAQLAIAATETRTGKAAHLNPDASLENVVLLLITAAKRDHRGERLSAHALLGLAADLLVGYEKRNSGGGADADLLDPRRRLEETHVGLAAILHECLFVPPGSGVRILADYLSQRYRSQIDEGLLRALQSIL